MDSDHLRGSSIRAEDMDNDLGQTLSKLIHDIGWPPRSGENQNHNVWKEIPCGVARVSYRTYFYENGKSRGLIIECQAYNNSTSEPSDRVQLDGDPG